VPAVIIVDAVVTAAALKSSTAITTILCHGWQPGSLAEHSAPGDNDDLEDTCVNINKGYNNIVVIFGDCDDVVSLPVLVVTQVR
jgi:hypothetical protein